MGESTKDDSDVSDHEYAREQKEAGREKRAGNVAISFIMYYIVSDAVWNSMYGVSSGSANQPRMARRARPK